MSKPDWSESDPHPIRREEQPPAEEDPLAKIPILPLGDRDALEEIFNQVRFHREVEVLKLRQQFRIERQKIKHDQEMAKQEAIHRRQTETRHWWGVVIGLAVLVGSFLVVITSVDQPEVQKTALTVIGTIFVAFVGYVSYTAGKGKAGG